VQNIIQVKNLIKKYGKLNAVDDISFEVKKNEVFGLLGENGAGKTTTLEIIEGLRRATSGEAFILGHDIKKGINNIKEKIGVQLQSSAYYQFLTLQEILSLFGSFYQKSLKPMELLEMVDLKDKARSYVNNLSGGQKQRFSIIASLINDPEIVFLDEPTTGLDPLARRHLWNIITKIKFQGKTIILTTHYMEEAEVLCDRVAIMDRGKILTMGETHSLIEHLKEPFTISFKSKQIQEKTLSDLSKLSEVKKEPGKVDAFKMNLKTQQEVNAALKYLAEIKPEYLNVGRATLEDVFIELTGKTILEDEEKNA